MHSGNADSVFALKLKFIKNIEKPSYGILQSFNMLGY